MLITRRLRKFGEQRLLPQEAPRFVLLPFLYQTRTIQQAFAISNNLDAGGHDAQPVTDSSTSNDQESSTTVLNSKPAHLPSPTKPQDNRLPKTQRSRATVQRHANPSRRRRDDGRSGHIPFEGTPGPMGVLGDLGGMKVSPRERKAFEALIKKGSPSRTDHQISSEQGDKLGGLLEEAFQGMMKKERPVSGAPNTLLDSALPLYKQLRKGIHNAESDAMLWKFLEAKVFDKIKYLEFGNSFGHGVAPVSSVEMKQSSRHTAQSDVRVWAICLPNILRRAMERFRDDFPTSPLGLSTMPALKSLGPNHVVLGVTTQLYNLHLHFLRTMHADVHGFNNTLAEMDREAYQFTPATLAAIDDMLAFASQAARGKFGSALKAVWATKRKQDGVVTLRRWQSDVDEGLQQIALETASIVASEPA